MASLGKIPLIIGVVYLVAGFIVGAMPVGPLAIHLAYATAIIGGTVIILAVLKILLAMIFGWPRACGVAVLLSIAQYPVANFVTLNPTIHAISLILAMLAPILAVLDLLAWIHSKRPTKVLP